MYMCDQGWSEIYSGVIATSAIATTSQWDNNVSYKSLNKDSKSDQVTERSLSGKHRLLSFYNSPHLTVSMLASSLRNRKTHR